jgi:hypothetical protein
MTHRRSRIVTFLAVLGVALLSGCASGGGGGSSGPAGEDQGLGTIEMQIWNRSDQTVAVFARWGNAPRVRLGNLSGSRRGSYTVYVQGPLVGISWDVMSGRPPAGTGAGFFPDVADGPGSPQCGVDVEAGDRIEWTIAADSYRCTYVRMDPAGFN